LAAVPKYKIETEFINGWVETGVYSLVVNASVATQLRRLRVDLGVWSRNEMARVDFEGGGVVRPFIADGLIGRSPS
jgi:hypothetical protein